MDEAPEFNQKVLEALRTPLESGTISIGRSELQTRYPARFQLVLAANPCPCGLAGSPGAQCQCPPMAVRRYRDRVSGPIRDRIDIQLVLLPMKRAFLKAALAQAETSSVVAERVLGARETAGASASRHRLDDQRGGRPVPTCGLGCRCPRGPS